LPGGTLPDDPQGFARFYQLIYERELPRHARTDWVQPLYAARAAGKGLVVAAFRGSTKTTTLSIAFTAFRLGQEPHKSVLLIQAGDRAAASTSGQIADLIERHPGWQAAFPHVEPDRKIGWGARGYEVCNTDLEYEKWRALCAREKGKDPSLVGLGYRSRAIIGKHPTGMLLLDDIHDENNTRSARELETVIKILTGTILPTVTPDTWQVFVGTPWTANDSLAHLKATDRFISAATPVYVQRPTSAVNNADVAPGTSDGLVPTWPERFPEEEIKKARQLSGEAEFARMYLLDLDAAEGMHLKGEWLHPYPHEKIQPHWPVVMGVDYASTADKQRDNDHDYFAVAIGCAQPSSSGIILIDGYRGHLSHAEAQDKLLELVAFYPNTEIIGIEAVSKGEEFYQSLSSHPHLPIVRMNPGGQGKGPRFQNVMAPLFQRGWARTSDKESPFMQTFRREWLRWPWGDHDDTLDAVYWMLFAGQSHLPPRSAKSKTPTPFSDLGRK